MPWPTSSLPIRPNKTQYRTGHPTPHGKQQVIPWEGSWLSLAFGLCGKRCLQYPCWHSRPRTFNTSTKTSTVDFRIGSHTDHQQKKSTISKTHLLSTKMLCTTCAGSLSTEQPTSNVPILSFSVTANVSKSAWPPLQRGTGMWHSSMHSTSLVQEALPLPKHSWKTHSTTNPPINGQFTTRHGSVAVPSWVYEQ